MSIVDSQIRTITCDGGCGKKILFDQKDQQATFQNNENAWLKGVRVIQTFDGRNFCYCGDECELKGVTLGKHNIPTIIQTAGQAQVNEAVKYAENVQKADEVAREGTKQIHIATS